VRQEVVLPEEEESLAYLESVRRYRALSGNGSLHIKLGRGSLRRLRMRMGIMFSKIQLILSDL